MQPFMGLSSILVILLILDSQGTEIYKARIKDEQKEEQEGAYCKIQVGTIDVL